MTADHGNCEQMWDYAANSPHTASTSTNDLPCFLVSERFKNASRSAVDWATSRHAGVSAGDSADGEMTGKNLVVA